MPTKLGNIVVNRNPQSEFEIAFGHNLREWRKKKRLSLAAMAQRMTDAGRPMSVGQLSNVERAKYPHPPSSKDIVAAAFVLDIPPAVLLLPQELGEIVLGYREHGIAGVLNVASRLLMEPNSE